MNNTQLDIMHMNICDNARRIALERGKEYSNQEDTLKTFRTAGQMLGIPASDVALVQMALKLARMQDNPKPDSTFDMINYTIYRQILVDEEKGTANLVESIKQLRDNDDGDKDAPFQEDEDDCCCCDDEEDYE